MVATKTCMKNVPPSRVRSNSEDIEHCEGLIFVSELATGWAYGCTQPDCTMSVPDCMLATCKIDNSQQNRSASLYNIYVAGQKSLDKQHFMKFT